MLIEDIRLDITEDLDSLFPQPGLGTKRCIEQVSQGTILGRRCRAEIVVTPIGQVVGVDGVSRYALGAGTGQEAEHIVHMTRFADVSSATLWALDPVVERNVPAIQAISNDERRPSILDDPFHNREGRRETAIDA